MFKLFNSNYHINFSTRRQLSMLAVIWLLMSGFLDSTASLNQKANKLYKDKRYQSAQELYQKAQVKNPSSAEIGYNLGATLYQLNQYEDAHHQFEKSIAQTKDAPLLSRTHYNYGNTLYRLGQLEEAVVAYKKALDLDPHDKDAKHNLELLLKKKNESDKKQEERNQKDQQKQEQQKKDNQNKSQSNQQKQQQNSQNQQKQDNQTGNQDQQNQDQKQEGGGDGSENQDKPKPDEQKPDKKASGQGAQDPNKPQEKSQEDEKDRQKDEETQDKPKKDALQQNTDLHEDKADMERPDSGKEQENPSGGLESEQKNYFQGQMSRPDAMRILDALKDSEKKMQILRRPKPQNEDEPQPDMDW